MGSLSYPIPPLLCAYMYALDVGLDAQYLEIQRGGSWGFGQIILKGVLGVVRKFRGVAFFRVLFHFYD
jgi:hypothetical protein